MTLAMLVPYAAGYGVQRRLFGNHAVGPLANVAASGLFGVSGYVAAQVGVSVFSS